MHQDLIAIKAGDRNSAGPHLALRLTAIGTSKRVRAASSPHAFSVSMIIMIHDLSDMRIAMHRGLPVSVPRARSDMFILASHSLASSIQSKACELPRYVDITPLHRKKVGHLALPVWAIDKPVMILTRPTHTYVHIKIKN